MIHDTRHSGDNTKNFIEAVGKGNLKNIEALLPLIDFEDFYWGREKSNHQGLMAEIFWDERDVDNAKNILQLLMQHGYTPHKDWDLLGTDFFYDVNAKHFKGLIDVIEVDSDEKMNMYKAILFSTEPYYGTELEFMIKNGFGGKRDDEGKSTLQLMWDIGFSQFGFNLLQDDVNARQFVQCCEHLEADGFDYNTDGEAVLRSINAFESMIAQNENHSPDAGFLALRDYIENFKIHKFRQEMQETLPEGRTKGKQARL